MTEEQFKQVFDMAVKYPSVCFVFSDRLRYHFLVMKYVGYMIMGGRDRVSITGTMWDGTTLHGLLQFGVRWIE